VLGWDARVDNEVFKEADAVDLKDVDLFFHRLELHFEWKQSLSAFFDALEVSFREEGSLTWHRFSPA
jgi:hypothetical protein